MSRHSYFKVLEDHKPFVRGDVVAEVRVLDGAGDMVKVDLVRRGGTKPAERIRATISKDKLGTAGPSKSGSAGSDAVSGDAKFGRDKKESKKKKKKEDKRRSHHESVKPKDCTRSNESALSAPEPIADAAVEEEADEEFLAVFSAVESADNAVSRGGLAEGNIDLEIPDEGPPVVPPPPPEDDCGGPSDPRALSTPVSTDPSISLPAAVVPPTTASASPHLIPRRATLTSADDRPVSSPRLKSSGSRRNSGIISSGGGGGSGGGVSGSGTSAGDDRLAVTAYSDEDEDSSTDDNGSRRNHGDGGFNGHGDVTGDDKHSGDDAFLSVFREEKGLGSTGGGGSVARRLTPDIVIPESKLHARLTGLAPISMQKVRSSTSVASHNLKKAQRESAAAAKQMVTPPTSAPPVESTGVDTDENTFIRSIRRSSMLPFDGRQSREFVTTRTDRVAVVLDGGSCHARLGFSGEWRPRSVFPSHIRYADDDPVAERLFARSQSPSSQRANGGAGAGSEPRSRGAGASASRPGSTARKGPMAGAVRMLPAGVLPSGNSASGSSGFVGERLGEHSSRRARWFRPVRNGVVQDWDEMEKLWTFGLVDSLKVDPEDHPVLLLESSPLLDEAHRERSTQLFFESFNVPSLYVASQSTMSVFAHYFCSFSTDDQVRQLSSGTVPAAVDLSFSALSLTLGADCRSFCVPLVDGCVLRQCSKQRDGVGLTAAVQQFMGLVNRVYNARNSSRPGPAAAAPSADEFRLLDRHQLLDEWAARTLLETMAVRQAQVTADQQPEFVCTLPSDSSVTLHLPPSLAWRALQPVIEQLASVVVDCLATVPDWSRPALVKQVLVSGTPAALVSMDRFTNSLQTAIHDKLLSPECRPWGEPLIAKLRVHGAATPVSNRTGGAAWLGGSVFASMDHFLSSAISKTEYEEIGPIVIHRKCFEF